MGIFSKLWRKPVKAIKETALSTSWSGRVPERRERVVIELELSKDEFEAHRLDIDTIVDNPVDPRTMFCDDRLHVPFSFDVEYFGNIVAKLEAVNRLIFAPGLVKSVNLQELRQGRSVILEVADNLSHLIESLQ